ncbi:MAG: hypothetical protein FVQ80_12895 [Planctomycetes bacterium]|nr:hypothetical protein [Planctomycetota bacterium]
MKHKKRTFITTGAIIGFLCGVLPITIAYMQYPSLPGMFEVLVQILILGFWVVVGSAFGFIVYLVAILFLKKEKK